jgi:hypothetical protein
MFALGICACTNPPTTNPPPPTTTEIALGPVQTATLRIGPYEVLGDAIDFGTDSVVPQYLGDFEITRDNTYRVGSFGGAQAKVIVDVGQLASVADAPLPPASFGDPAHPAPLPATIGETFVVLSHVGCPAVVRVTGELRGPATLLATGETVPDAYLGAIVEYAIADCRALAIETVQHVQSGTCPFGQSAGPAYPLTATFAGWPALTAIDSSTPQTLQIPHGFEVTIDEQDPTTWSGACSGSGSCKVVMAKDESVLGTIDLPLRCNPGA